MRMSTKLQNNPGNAALLRYEILVACGLQLNLTFSWENAGFPTWRQSQAGKGSPGRTETARLPPAVRDEPTVVISALGWAGWAAWCRCLFCCGARWAGGFTAPGRRLAAAAWIRCCLEHSLALKPPTPHCELTHGPSSALPSAAQLQCVRLQPADKGREEQGAEAGWENAQRENVLYFHSGLSALPACRRIHSTTSVPLSWRDHRLGMLSLPLKSSGYIFQDVFLRKLPYKTSSYPTEAFVLGLSLATLQGLFFALLILSCRFRFPALPCPNTMGSFLNATARRPPCSPPWLLQDGGLGGKGTASPSGILALFTSHTSQLSLLAATSQNSWAVSSHHLHFESGGQVPRDSGNLFPIEIPNVIHAGKVSHLYNLFSAST